MAGVDAAHPSPFALLDAHAKTTGAGVLVIDANDSVVFHNDRFREWWPAPPDVLVRRSTLVDWLMSAADEGAHEVAAFLQWRDPGAGEIALPTARVIRVHSTRVGGTGARMWSFHDLTSRRQLESALQDAGSMLRMLEAHTEGVVLELDPDARVVGMFARVASYFTENDAKLRGRTLSEVLGRRCKTDCDAIIREVFQARRGRRFEFAIELDDNERLFLADAVYLATSEEATPRVTIMLRDITERHRVQVQLLEAERLASVGLLAAGVAHEINNPLAYTLLNLQRLESGLRGLAANAPPETLDELSAAVDMSLEGARRVQAIVSDMLHFSRTDRAEAATTIDVRRVLDFAIEMANHEIRERATIVREFGDVPLVMASESRLSQVFLNLIANAAQAIPDGQPDRNEIRLVTRTDTRGRAVVEIHDTGVGMAPQLSARIFDPFYTTKPGVGIGLGLTLCQGIATLLGGRLAVESQLGRGSVFRLVLPPAETTQS
jgi:signal transduction histidine kinase